MTAYVVESRATGATGQPAGTFRLYVATEARAREIAGAAPGRTFRAVAADELPEAARANLEQAARSTS